MKKTVRLFAFAAALVLILSQLCSCSLILLREDVHDLPTGVIKATAPVTQKIEAPSVPTGSDRTYPAFDPVIPMAIFPDYNNDGRYFTVLSLKNEKLFCPPDDELFNYTSHELIKALELKFSLSVIQSSFSEETLLDEVEKLFGSGGYYADAVILPYKYYEPMKERGYLSTFDKKAFYIPGSDFYDAGTMEKMNGSDSQTYVIYSKALFDPREAYCVFFDRNAFDGDTLYELVKSGKWTRGELEGAAKGKSCVLDPGVSSFIGDCFDSAAIAASHGDISGFKEGRAALAVAPVSAIDQLCSEERAFGILPLPVKNEGDPYFSYCGELGEIPVMMCPSVPGSHDSSMLILASICAGVGDGYVNSAKEYYSELVRDNGSYYMLDYIFSDILIEFPEDTGTEQGDDPGPGPETDPETDPEFDPETEPGSDPESDPEPAD